MRPVGKCDPSTHILGFKSSIPVFVSGAALAKLGHPDGIYIYQDTPSSGTDHAFKARPTLPKALRKPELPKWCHQMHLYRIAAS